MNDMFPGGDHPDQDMLADLAAGVLPAELARGVEAHVMSCGFCEEVLVDAERVRSLLVAPAPGPMPDDVWTGIVAALRAEQSHGPQAVPAANWFDTPAPGTPVPTASPYDQAFTVQVPSPAPLPAPPPPSMSFDEAPTAAWKAFLTEPPPPPPAEPVQERVGRAVRSLQSRRDVRAEDQGERAWWSRPGLVAAVAAVSLSVLGLGGWGAMELVGDDKRADSAADSIPGRGKIPLVRASGTDYTAATLPQLAKLLVAPPATASGKAPSPGAGSAAPVKPGTVSDPAKLAECLASLGPSNRQALAVDLARYHGREAAIIVVPGTLSGYEAWVVARDCNQAEGALAFVKVPA